MADKVWITRTAPGGEATADRVRDLGFEPLVAPLLATQAVGEGAIDLTGVGALAFTSANAVDAFARRTADRRRRVFAVGSATAARARAAGFADVRSANGDVAALARLIGATAAEIEGEVLHPVAAEPAGDLAAVGASIRTLTIYDTAPAPLPDELARSMANLDAVLVYSPKAARLLADILRARPAPNLRLLCLSAAVAAPLTEVIARELSVAALPNEEALLNLLVD
jgi:uroporphyrinogen-III synthase